MQHKHFKMIVAKAENMDLVVLIRYHEQGWWEQASSKDVLPCGKDYDYFLCLPQHVNACLHALNGGEAQVYSFGGWKYGLITSDWDKDFWYMRDSYESRIKPKKEKRWIGITTFTRETTCVFNTKEEALREVTNPRWQIIEIEVEV